MLARERLGYDLSFADGRRRSGGAIGGEVDARWREVRCAISWVGASSGVLLGCHIVEIEGCCGERNQGAEELVHDGVRLP